jgi:ribonuclease VapC
MVVDTSAVIAILLNEPEAERIARALVSEDRPLMSAFSALETGLVIEARKGEAGAREWQLLQHQANIDLVPFESGQLALAQEAWRKYGKGRHEAGLNIGDCCAYALARHIREPLLFKGEDFARTDADRVEW